MSIEATIEASTQAEAAAISCGLQERVIHNTSGIRKEVGSLQLEWMREYRFLDAGRTPKEPEKKTTGVDPAAGKARFEGRER